MPTAEIAEKLVRRMINLKDPVKELWAGFDVNVDLLTNSYKYAVWTGEPEKQ